MSWRQKSGNWWHMFVMQKLHRGRMTGEVRRKPGASGILGTSISGKNGVNCFRFC